MDFNAGNSVDRRWAEPLAASGQLHGHHRAASHGRRHSSGSPPHGRGTPHRRSVWRAGRRLTPARAGEHAIRGGELRGGFRLTPARAGNTAGRCRCRRRTRAHPRTGGEHRQPDTLWNVPVGSPPHGRGTPKQRVDGGERLGLTPARAGNTPPRLRRWSGRSAHPRTGGEHPDDLRQLLDRAGSPPHGRGTLALESLGAGDQGLTPARAGNTRVEGLRTGSGGAHPRTGGEHALYADSEQL